MCIRDSPKTYEKFLEEIIEKKTVYLEGKIQIDEYKGEKTIKLLVEKIISLDKLYEDVYKRQLQVKGLSISFLYFRQ